MSVHCDVWWARPDDSPRMRTHLDLTERERHAAYRRNDDRARFVTGRAVARAMVTARTGLAQGQIRFTTVCPHCGAAHGKPKLAGSDIELSISHSGDRVVVATATGFALGVDVERVIHCDLGSLAPAVLAEPEQAILAVQPPELRHQAFFRYWSRKEAVLKAMGTGLATEMSSIVVSGPDDPPRLLAWSGQSTVPDVCLVDLDAGNEYVAALAVLTRNDLSLDERHLDDFWEVPRPD